MSLPPDVELVFRSRATGLRLDVNPYQLFAPAWTLTEAGGTEQITCGLKVPFERLPVSNGDLCEVWVLNTGETLPRCRGIVATPERSLDLKEQLKLTAFGYMEDMAHTLLDKIVPHYELAGADLSLYAAEIFADHVKRKQASTGFVPQYDQDLQLIGVSLKQLDVTNTTARAAMDKLYEQAGGNMVWGWDINPLNGNDRFYVRPRTPSTGYVYTVGVGVKTAQAANELAGVNNAIKIEGGPARYPNYLENSSFEVPQPPDADTGNLLGDGGFELGTGSTWQYVNGASRTQNNQYVNHAAHTGTWEVPLDAVGKEVYQEILVTLNTTYIASIFAALQSSQTASIQLIVEGRNSAGTVTETVLQQTITPPSVAWVGGQGSTVLASDSLAWNVVFTNSATTKARYRAKCTVCPGGNSHGVMIDDCVFCLQTAAGQASWATHFKNYDSGNSSNILNYVDWISRQAAFEGTYGVRLSTTTNDTDEVYLSVLGAQHPSAQNAYIRPTPQQSLFCCAMVRMAAGLNSAAGSVALEMRSWAGDGHENDYKTTGATSIPNDGAWHLVYYTWSIHGDTSMAALQLNMLGSGVYDVDAWSARDAAAWPLTLAAITAGTASGIEAAYRQEYLRGTNFERYVDVTDPNVAPLLSSGAANSINLYGRREAIWSNKDLTEWNSDAYAAVAAYFNQLAVLIARPRVDLAHVLYTTPDPGSGLQCLVTGTGTAQDAPNDVGPAWISKASYAFVKQALTVQLEMTNERPTLAKLLKTISSSASGGGAASSIAAAAGNNTNNGGGGTLPTAALAQQIDVFSPSGTQTAFTLSQIPAGSVVCYQQPDGVKIAQSAVSNAGTTLTLSYAPIAGSGTLEAVYWYLPVQS